MNNFFHKYPYTNFHELNLDWILEKINEFDAKLKSWSEIVEELQSHLAEIDSFEERLEAVESSISDLNEIRQHLTNLDNDVANLDSKFTREIENLNRTILNIDVQFDTLANAINNLKDYVDVRDAALQVDYNNKIYELEVKLRVAFKMIEDEIDLLLQIINQIDTSAYNPWPRILDKESIQKNINYAYEDLADNIPLAMEYQELGLTASEYAAYGLTAREYALRGSKRLHLDFVYSPVYGFKQNISNVLTSIVNFICGTFSATEYAALDLTADEYAALDLSSEQYFSFNTNGTGLTADEYAALSKLNNGLIIS